MHVGDPLSELDWVAETAKDPRSNNYDRFCDWWDHHTETISMEKERVKITSAGRSLGWSNLGRMKRVSCMPLHVFNIMRQITHGEFASNTPEGRAMLHKFLVRHPEYSTNWHGWL